MRVCQEKDKICDNNYEVLQELISKRDGREINSNHNLNQNENNTDNGKGNKLFKRQLTATSQYGDDDIINEEDNNPFIYVTRSRRKQQRLEDKEIIEVDDNNDPNTIEHNTSSTTAKNGSRLFINSSKRTNKNDHMYYDKRSADMSLCQ
jgi:hypothetical protein